MNMVVMISIAASPETNRTPTIGIYKGCHANTELDR